MSDAQNMGKVMRSSAISLPWYFLITQANSRRAASG
jgi:hypothetical protein